MCPGGYLYFFSGAHKEDKSSDVGADCLRVPVLRTKNRDDLNTVVKMCDLMAAFSSDLQQEYLTFKGIIQESLLTVC